MMRIAVASGKGGTGKTTLAVNMAAMLHASGKNAVLVDCDVEEPNAHLYLPVHWSKVENHIVPVPRINTAACLGEGCAKCIDLCRFKALIWMVDAVLPFPELCHSCGLCMEACPVNCIDEDTRVTGVVRHGEIASGNLAGLEICSGEIRVGEAMAPPLIRAVKEAAKEHAIQIWDCPPGTSCPVITSVHGADAVILVTEPTPFGLHDLTLAVALLRRMGIRFGVVVNKFGLGDDRVERYLDQERISLLGRVPHTMEAAQTCAAGSLLMELPGFADIFEKIWSKTAVLAREGKS
jgi:MinD superfamily P-loop ATPase